MGSGGQRLDGHHVDAGRRRPSTFCGLFVSRRTESHAEGLQYRRRVGVLAGVDGQSERQVGVERVGAPGPARRTTAACSRGRSPGPRGRSRRRGRPARRQRWRAARVAAGHRSRSAATPVRRRSGIRSGPWSATSSPPSSSPFTSARYTDPDAHSKAWASNTPAEVGRGTLTSLRGGPPPTFPPSRGTRSRIGGVAADDEGRDRAARAVVFEAPRRVAVVPVDLRAPGDGEVLVRTLWSGISGGHRDVGLPGRDRPRAAARRHDRGARGLVRLPVPLRVQLRGPRRAPMRWHPRRSARVRVPPPPGRVRRRRRRRGRSSTTSIPGSPPCSRSWRRHCRWPSTPVRCSSNRSRSPVSASSASSSASCCSVPEPASWASSHSASGGRSRRPSGCRPLRPTRRPRRSPANAPAGLPLVVEASGRPDALRDALPFLAHEGEALVVSWYGTKDVRLPLGAEFHRRRLRIRSTQVSSIPAALTARWTRDRRRAVVRELLHEAAARPSGHPLLPLRAGGRGVRGGGPGRRRPDARRPVLHVMPMYQVGTAIEVRAFHVMPGVEGPEGQLHAHDYKVEVLVERADLDERGMVCDLDVLDGALQRVGDTVRDADLDADPAGGRRGGDGRGLRPVGARRARRGRPCRRWRGPDRAGMGVTDRVRRLRRSRSRERVSCRFPAAGQVVDPEAVGRRGPCACSPSPSSPSVRRNS